MGVEKGYTLQIYTADGGEGYFLHECTSTLRALLMDTPCKVTPQTIE